MDACKPYRAQTTQFVDGELPDTERMNLEVHLARCPHCRAAVATERAMRTLLCSRRLRLRQSAPPHLRDTVASLGRHRDARGWRRFVRSRPAVATAVLVVAAVAGYGLIGRGGQALAAQLALDHLKCTRILRPQPGADVGTQAARWQSRHGWKPPLPTPPPGSPFRFVALRRCVHTGGLMAHALYRKDDTLLSLFVLQGDVRPESLREIMGQRASFWTDGHYTYAAVASADASALGDFRQFATRAVE